MKPFSPKPPVCFISPHLDDAAWSCGHLIASLSDVVVLTVFTGAPHRVDEPGWNEHSTGKHAPGKALEVRRQEDRAALESVGARWKHLPLIEWQYAEDMHDAAAVGEAVRAALEELRPSSVFFPVGFVHPDHFKVRDVCMRLVADDESGRDWYVYADLPYAHAREDELAGRLSMYGQPERIMPVEVDGNAKTLLARRYRTQWEWHCDHVPEALLEESMLIPERYWRLVETANGVKWRRW